MQPSLTYVSASAFPRGGPIRMGLPVGQPAWPDAPVAPIGLAAIDRVPLSVRGRQLAPAPIRAIPHKASVKSRPRASLPTRMSERISRKIGCEALGYRSSGAIFSEIRTEIDIREANRWLAGCPIRLNATCTQARHRARYRALTPIGPRRVSAMPALHRRCRIIRNARPTG